MKYLVCILLFALVVGGCKKDTPEDIMPCSESYCFLGSYHMVGGYYGSSLKIDTTITITATDNNTLYVYGKHLNFSPSSSNPNEYLYLYSTASISQYTSLRFHKPFDDSAFYSGSYGGLGSGGTIVLTGVKIH